MTGLVIVAATVFSYVVGWMVGRPLLVPILNAAASYPIMVVTLRRGEVRRAVGRMLLWALALGICATALSYWRPAETDRLFLRGEAYRVEMQVWVLTGVGAESRPATFIPQQARDAAVFVALGLASGGALAMAMGAALMNQMGHYVGTLAANGTHPVALMILAWHPWSVIRIISFVIMGVVLAMPVVARRRPDAPLLLAASGGLIIDVVMKTLLAPAWQRLLLRLLS